MSPLKGQNSQCDDGHFSEVCHPWFNHNQKNNHRLSPWSWTYWSISRNISTTKKEFRQVASDCDHALQKMNTLKGVIQYNLTENNIEGRQWTQFRHFLNPSIILYGKSVVNLPKALMWQAVFERVHCLGCLRLDNTQFELKEHSHSHKKHLCVCVSARNTHIRMIIYGVGLLWKWHPVLKWWRCTWKRSWWRGRCSHWQRWPALSVRGSSRPSWRESVTASISFLAFSLQTPLGNHNRIITITWWLWFARFLWFPLICCIILSLFADSAQTGYCPTFQC